MTALFDIDLATVADAPAPVSSAAVRARRAADRAADRARRRLSASPRGPRAAAETHRGAALAEHVDPWLSTDAPNMDLLVRGGIDPSRVIAHLATRCGPFQELLACTFAVGPEPLAHLRDLRAAGHIGRIVVLCDTMLTTAKLDTRSMLRDIADQYATAPTHAKIYVLAGERPGFVVTGSANLTLNPRTELLSLSRQPELIDFYADFIRRELLRDQTDRSQTP
jgi:hypothetical protein